MGRLIKAGRDRGALLFPTKKKKHRRQCMQERAPSPTPLQKPTTSER